MTVSGQILALDLATTTGFCLGVPGEGAPLSGSKILKTKAEPHHIAGATLLHWLNTEWAKQKPALVVKERRMDFGGFQKKASSRAAMESQIKLHGCVEALSGMFDVPFEDVAHSTMMKHFVGSGKLDRKDGKLAVIKQARLLGYIPKWCDDEDRADSCALWDFAAATFARRSGGELRLFVEAT